MKTIILTLTLLLSIICFSCSKIHPHKIPEAPSNLQAQIVNSDIVNITWKDNSSNEDFFKVEIRIDSGSFELIENARTNITSIDITYLTPGATYTFRIRAQGKYGLSDYSNEVSITL